MHQEGKLYREDFMALRRWLGLKVYDITWQGRFVEEFEAFLKMVFVEGGRFQEVCQRFDELLAISPMGPQYSWLLWMKNKFLCFLFVKKNLSLRELSQLSGLEVGVVAGLLRNFFLVGYPHLEGPLSEIFQVALPLDERARVRFSDIQRALPIGPMDRGSYEDEIMPGLEVTLCEGWGGLLRALKKRPRGARGRKRSLKRSVVSLVGFCGSFLMVLAVFLAIFLPLRYLNQKREEKILDKISLYGPKLSWPDKALEAPRPLAIRSNVAIDMDLSDVEVDGQQRDREIIERSGTESEVILSSVNEPLPNSLQREVRGKISDYEEVKAKGLRDYRFGRNVVYRIHLSSDDLLASRDNLNRILSSYKTSQVDHVRPGQIVPGGLYYNLFVADHQIGPLLEEISQRGRGKIYQSRIRVGNPPGLGRVFIWVKSI